MADDRVRSLERSARDGDLATRARWTAELLRGRRPLELWATLRAVGVGEGCSRLTGEGCWALAEALAAIDEAKLMAALASSGRAWLAQVGAGDAWLVASRQQGLVSLELVVERPGPSAMRWHEAPLHRARWRSDVHAESWSVAFAPRPEQLEEAFHGLARSVDPDAGPPTVLSSTTEQVHHLLEEAEVVWTSGRLRCLARYDLRYDHNMALDSSLRDVQIDGLPHGSGMLLERDLERFSVAGPAHALDDLAALWTVACGDLVPPTARNVDEPGTLPESWLARGTTFCGLRRPGAPWFVDPRSSPRFAAHVIRSRAGWSVSPLGPVPAGQHIVRLDVEGTGTGNSAPEPHSWARLLLDLELASSEATGPRRAGRFGWTCRDRAGPWVLLSEHHEESHESWDSALRIHHEAGRSPAIVARASWEAGRYHSYTVWLVGDEAADLHEPLARLRGWLADRGLTVRP